MCPQEPEPHSTIADETRNDLMTAPVTWFCGLVLALTWFPYVQAEALGGLTLEAPTRPAEVLGNVALFIPVGLCLGARVRIAARLGLVRAVLVITALTLTVEAVQLLVEGRHASPFDVALNVTGGVVGWGIGFRAAGRGRGPALDVAAVAVVWAVLAVAALGSVLLTRGPASTLAEWDPRFPVVAGDEVGGGRAYEGLVTDATLCGGSPRQPVCLGPGAGADERRRLHAAATASGQILARARVHSASDRQAGPTRIVSFSGDAWQRNVTLGQEGRALILRVRTPAAGPNGNDLFYHLGDAITAGAATAVEAQFDRGAVRMVAESESARVTGSFRPGLFQAWLLAPLLVDDVRKLAATGSDPLYLGLRVERGRKAGLVAALLLSFPLGMAAAGTKIRASRALALGAGAPVVLALLGDALAGQHSASAELMIAAAAGLAGAALHRRSAGWMPDERDAPSTNQINSMNRITA